MSGFRQVGNVDRYMLDSRGRICGFILQCIRSLEWVSVQASPAQPTHRIRRVLAAHTAIKPAPQFPPTREAPPSVPSLLPGRAPFGRITSGSPVAQPACLLLSPHFLSRFHPRPLSLPTAATSFLGGSGDYVTSQKESCELDDLLETRWSGLIVLLDFT